MGSMRKLVILMTIVVACSDSGDDDASAPSSAGRNAIVSGDPGGRGANAGGSAGTADTAPRVDCVPPSFPEGIKTCHTDQECTGGATCVPEILPPQQCGSPCPGCATDRCMTDADCSGGVCEPSKEFPGIIMQCVPSCADAGCSAGNRCASDGRCRPILCTEGFACAEHMRCSAGSALVDAHGCEPIPCDEPGGAECSAPAVCTSEQPRLATAPHGCALVPCADPRHPGCEPNTHCRPELESQGNYGCARKTCQRDADCDCGACIVRSGSEGLCYDHIGVCVAAGTLSCPA